MKNIEHHMQRFLERLVDQGKERGVQLSVYYRGELIVDACAGTADSRDGKPVAATTLFPVFSVTKGLVATVVHLLAEEGRLNYDRRICEIWPEFGANGKERVTIRHALTHTMGIPGMPDGTSLMDAADWSRMCSAVARMTPDWVPGERMEYHARTFGWVLGEVIRRIAGRPFPQVMREKICLPLGIEEDMYAGIPDEAEPRIAILEEPGREESAADSLPAPVPEARLLSPEPRSIPLFAWMNTPEARRACVPSTNGIMTAQAIARHYAALLPGGVDGIELLPPSRVATATVPLQLQDGVPVNMSLGYRLGASESPMGSRPSVFGHGGYGGSIAFADRDCQLAVGLVHNRLSDNGATKEIIHELKRKLDIPID
ncbi:MAG: class beta-lactamase-related serine hydrolase [Paenibacillaceae bacterium]|jgi:CubicO group peptidase (beta-lactamase class C family)|nr:class beta-lactamase-related serine hydrolase [Paenibacillaceae bacterium]